MKGLIKIFTTTLLSTTATFAQGTMSPDDNPASEAEASMSGYSQDQIDLREEEVQLQEDDYDPSVDDAPIEIETDPELIKQYDEEVDQSAP